MYWFHDYNVKFTFRLYSEIFYIIYIVKFVVMNSFKIIVLNKENTVYLMYIIYIDIRYLLLNN